MKRVCQSLQKPFFEVFSWPMSELEQWALAFSIDDNGDKPTVMRKTHQQDPEAAERAFEEAFCGKG